MALSDEQMAQRRELIAKFARKKVIDTTRARDDDNDPHAVDRVIESRKDGKNLFR